MSLLTQFYGSGAGGGTGLPVEILLVGGGGGGGGVGPLLNMAAAGGGSGQFLYGAYHFDYDKSLTVTIGAGGAGGTGPSTPQWYGVAGGDSRFGYVVAYGGGGGGAGPGFQQAQYNPTYRSNQNYGSSGGVIMQSAGSFKVIMGSQPLGGEYITRLGDFGGPRSIDTNDGTTTTEAYALNNGFISGRKTTPHGFIAFGAGNISPEDVGGGGGGAGGAPPGPVSPYNVLGSIRTDPSPSNNQYFSNGGAGLPGSVIGYPTLEFAGGGGGGSRLGQGIGDGQAGGGDGAPGSTGFGNNATANSGSGGGGASNAGSPNAQDGGNGGSGVCIIRYPTEYSAATVSGNTPTPAQPGYHVYRWNGPGSITFNT